MHPPVPRRSCTVTPSSVRCPLGTTTSITLFDPLGWESLVKFRQLPPVPVDPGASPARYRYRLEAARSKRRPEGLSRLVTQTLAFCPAIRLTGAEAWNVFTESSSAEADCATAKESPTIRHVCKRCFFIWIRSLFLSFS